MSSAKNLALGLLSLTTVGGALLAWQQYGELVELRAAALNPAEREDLLRRIADLERMNRDLQARPAPPRRGPPDAPGDGPGGPPRGEPRGDLPRPPDDPRSRGNDVARAQGAALRDLMARPEVQALLTAQQRAAIEARYDPLFRKLNLSPEQSAKLTALLADRGNTRRDVEDAARAQGIDPRQNPEAFRQLLGDAQAVLDAGIKSVIGDSGFAQLATFEQTLPQRNLVDQLQQRLVHTNVPLTPAQTEQLVQILATHSPAPTRPAGTPGFDRPPSDTMVFEFGRGGGPGFGPPPGGPDSGRMIVSALGGPGMGPPPGGPGPVAVVTPAAVAQAQTVLVPQQLEALQKIQQTQAAQQQVQQLIRQTIATATQNAGGTSAPSTPPAAGSDAGPASSPPRKRPGGG